MDNMKTALETITKIYQMLEDDESKDIYMNRLAFSATSHYKYISKIAGTYIEHRFSYFSDRMMNELLALLPKDRNFVLYGAGKNGARLLPYFSSDKRFAGFCSSTKKKQESGYLGFPVMSPEELLSKKDLCVVISTLDFKNVIMQSLKDGGYPQELIIDAPSFYIPAHSVEAEQYFGPSFLKFQEEEVFVDVGCLNFGSSLAMSKHCKQLKVYAFEPDPENYQLCLKKIEERDKSRLTDVKLFPYGAWSEKTTLYFNKGRSESSRVCAEDKGNCSVPVMRIDEAIEPEDRVTMLKMDIEGSELEALKGARETIQRDKPKLAICIYHKAEDLWEIPLYIKELVPEYRFYIRHHNFDESETVLYAVMPE